MIDNRELKTSALNGAVLLMTESTVGKWSLISQSIRLDDSNVMSHGATDLSAESTIYYVLKYNQTMILLQSFQII